MLLITGANGQLGLELKKFYSSEEALFVDKDDLDITDLSKVNNYCQNNKINGIINCAAYTAVDKAEEEKDICYAVNVSGVENLSKISNELKIPFIHISTDYVFDGKNHKPYIEDDKTNPQSVYGKSKVESEKKFMDLAYSGAVIRTSWLYSEFSNNFVKTMMRLGKERDSLNVVFDQIGTPTYAYDLAKAIYDVFPQIKEKGIYHFSNEGAASWYDFAKEIMDLKEIDCKVYPLEGKDYPTPASRPFYSILNKSKIKQDFKITITHWKESLKKCLQKIS